MDNDLSAHGTKITAAKQSLLRLAERLQSVSGCRKWHELLTEAEARPLGQLLGKKDVEIALLGRTALSVKAKVALVRGSRETYGSH